MKPKEKNESTQLLLDFDSVKKACENSLNEPPVKPAKIVRFDPRKEIYKRILNRKMG